MYKKKQMRMIAMVLALSIVIVAAPALGAGPQAGPERDPFAEMRDDHVNQNKPDSKEREAAFGQAEGRLPGSPMRGPGPEAGKTDRYIIRYRDGRKASFARKASTMIADTVDILAPEINTRTGAFGLNHDDERAPVAIPPLGNALDNMELLILPAPMFPSEVAAELKARGTGNDILYIQPDFVLQLAGFGFEADETGGEEGAKNEETSEGEEAAGGEEGEAEPGRPHMQGAPPREVVVAVIDTGIDTGHEMLDGYLHSAAPNTPTDSLAYAHCTHLSGVIVNTAKQAGADIKILPIRVFDTGGGGAYTSDIIAAIYYSASLGAEVINCSFGSTAHNQGLFDAIAGCGALTVCAVGNNRRDFDEIPLYPAGYSSVLPNVISVASVNSDSGFSSYSSYGSGSIDIAALGRDVYSAFPGNKYGTMTGTSCSAAYVSGAAASVLSREPMEAWELRARLIYTADKLTNLQNKVIDGRRVNLANALAGRPGAILSPDYEEDFDVHGYVRSGEENWQLFSSISTVQVAAAGNHTLVLKANGSVWTFGDNVNYSLSPGCTVPEYYAAPEEVIGLTNIVKIAAGETHNLAIRYDGTLWSWGDNTYGQLGDGTYAERFTPVQAIGIMGAVDISAGYYHSLAALSGGEVYGMGDDSYSQLSAGSSSPAPVRIPGPYGAVYVHADGNRSLAVEKGGCVWVWGDDYSYNGGAVSIAELEGYKARVGIAIKPDGSVWAWEVQPGKHGIDYCEGEVQWLSSIVEISGGSFNGLALKDDGTVWHTDWDSGTVAMGLDNIVGIANGYDHYLALDIYGDLRAWGDNTYGQLGDSTATSNSNPVLVAMPHKSGVSFDSAGYSIAIPKSGSSGIGMAATAYDFAGWPIPNAAIGYSLESPYPGVGINASTGYVTVDSTAQPGTASVKADYHGYNATTLLVLKPYEATVIELSVAQDGEYRITLSANDVPTFIGKAITIRYDPKELQLMDAAEHVYGAFTMPGAIPGTGITITSLTPGALVLTFEQDIPAGKTWTGVITVIKFKALASGAVFVSVE